VNKVLRKYKIAPTVQPLYKLLDVLLLEKKRGVHNDIVKRLYRHEGITQSCFITPALKILGFDK